jgi:hypothetical protein
VAAGSDAARREDFAPSRSRMSFAGAWGSLTRAWDRIPLREPWRVLVPLLVVHWLAIVAFTARAHHNGWLFYQGGDQIWYWTTGWLLGHGSITQPFVTQGWSLVLVPFTWFGGAGFLAGLPAALLLQVAVLAPIALWCMYELGARIGGRVIGYLAAVMWTLGPYVFIPLLVHRYHAKYVDQFLPVPLGLTAMADYVGTVCLLASAVFTLRAIGNRDPATAVLAGLTFGFAAVIKPSNLIYFIAPLVVLLAARRWRELVLVGASVAPAVVALALWKYRGLGYLPAFAYEETQVALGTDTLSTPYHKYGEIDWAQLQSNLASLREVFWSMRVLEWLPFAGAIAVARRSVPLALFFSAWFWAFFILKGSSVEATVDSGSFFRFLLPGIPALLLLAAALPLLVPKYGAELAARTALPAARAVGRRALIAGVILLGLVPIVGAAAASPLIGGKDVIQHAEIAVPVGHGLHLSATVRGETVGLRWTRPPTRGTHVFYKLFRSPANTDYICFSRDRGADTCTLVSVELHTLRQRAHVDRPGPGTWTYRVGAGANWLDDPELGDIFQVSNPVTVTVK